MSDTLTILRRSNLSLTVGGSQSAELHPPAGLVARATDDTPWGEIVPKDRERAIFGFGYNEWPTFYLGASKALKIIEPKTAVPGGAETYLLLDNGYRGEKPSFISLGRRFDNWRLSTQQGVNEQIQLLLEQGKIHPEQVGLPGTSRSFINQYGTYELEELQRLVNHTNLVGVDSSKAYEIFVKLLPQMANRPHLREPLQEIYTSLGSKVFEKYQANLNGTDAGSVITSKQMKERINSFLSLGQQYRLDTRIFASQAAQLLRIVDVVGNAHYRGMTLEGIVNKRVDEKFGTAISEVLLSLFSLENVAQFGGQIALQKLITSALTKALIKKGMDPARAAGRAAGVVGFVFHMYGAVENGKSLGEATTSFFKIKNIYEGLARRSYVSSPSQAVNIADEILGHIKKISASFGDVFLLQLALHAGSKISSSKKPSTRTQIGDVNILRDIRTGSRHSNSSELPQVLYPKDFKANPEHRFLTILEWVYREDFVARARSNKTAPWDGTSVTAGQITVDGVTFKVNLENALGRNGKRVAGVVTVIAENLADGTKSSYSARVNPTTQRFMIEPGKNGKNGGDLPDHLASKLRGLDTSEQAGRGATRSSSQADGIVDPIALKKVEPPLDLVISKETDLIKQASKDAEAGRVTKASTLVEALDKLYADAQTNPILAKALLAWSQGKLYKAQDGSLIRGKTEKDAHGNTITITGEHGVVTVKIAPADGSAYGRSTGVDSRGLPKFKDSAKRNAEKATGSQKRTDGNDTNGTQQLNGKADRIALTDAKTVSAESLTGRVLIALEAAKLSPKIFIDLKSGEGFPYRLPDGTLVKLTKEPSNGRWVLGISVKDSNGAEIARTSVRFNTATLRFEDGSVSAAVRNARPKRVESAPILLPAQGTQEHLIDSLSGKTLEQKVKLVKDWINGQNEVAAIVTLGEALKKSDAGKKIWGHPEINGDVTGVATTRKKDIVFARSQGDQATLDQTMNGSGSSGQPLRGSAASDQALQVARNANPEAAFVLRSPYGDFYAYRTSDGIHTYIGDVRGKGFKANNDPSFHYRDEKPNRALALKVARDATSEVDVSVYWRGEKGLYFVRKKGDKDFTGYVQNSRYIPITKTPKEQASLKEPIAKQALQIARNVDPEASFVLESSYGHHYAYKTGADGIHIYIGEVRGQLFNANSDLGFQNRNEKPNRLLALKVARESNPSVEVMVQWQEERKRYFVRNNLNNDVIGYVQNSRYISIAKTVKEQASLKEPLSQQALQVARNANPEATFVLESYSGEYYAYKTGTDGLPTYIGDVRRQQFRVNTDVSAKNGEAAPNRFLALKVAREANPEVEVSVYWHPSKESYSVKRKVDGGLIGYVQNWLFVPISEIKQTGSKRATPEQALQVARDANSEAAFVLQGYASDFYAYSTGADGRHFYVGRVRGQEFYANDDPSFHTKDAVPNRLLALKVARDANPGAYLSVRWLPSLGSYSVKKRGDASFVAYVQNWRYVQISKVEQTSLNRFNDGGRGSGSNTASSEAQVNRMPDGQPSARGGQVKPKESNETPAHVHSLLQALFGSEVEFHAVLVSNKKKIGLNNEILVPNSEVYEISVLKGSNPQIKQTVGTLAFVTIKQRNSDNEFVDVTVQEFRPATGQNAPKVEYSGANSSLYGVLNSQFGDRRWSITRVNDKTFQIWLETQRGKQREREQFGVARLTYDTWRVVKF
jgi:hypothetical protein